MSKDEALYQSIASCGATLIAFIGVSHEYAGNIVFPWGPALFGGAAGRHAVGIFMIASGLLMIAGTLRLISFPVVPLALLMAVFCVAIGTFAAYAYDQFHLFAFAAAASAISTAFFHWLLDIHGFVDACAGSLMPMPHDEI